MSNRTEQVKAVEEIILKEGYIYAPKDLTRLATAIVSSLVIDEEKLDQFLRNPSTTQHLGGSSKRWHVEEDGCIYFAGCGDLAHAISTADVIRVRKMEDTMSNRTKCEVCGSPVKIVGNTTKHYESLVDTEIKKAELRGRIEAANYVLCDMQESPAKEYHKKLVSKDEAQLKGLGE